MKIRRPHSAGVRRLIQNGRRKTSHLFSNIRRKQLRRVLATVLLLVVLLPFYRQSRIDTTKRPPGRLLMWLHKTIDSMNFARGYQWAVFYNVYIPFEKDGINSALKIVAEQIDQVGLATKLMNQTVTVYFNTIGNGGVLNRQYMDALCVEKNGITCRHLAHYEHAHEEVSLQALYDYCASSYFSTVIYMHSKGSFHRDDGSFSGQDRWRRHMMNAATSEMCLKPHNVTCDTCGLLFQPLPSLHFTGNIWTAKCSYVQRLLPPKAYWHRMNRLTGRFNGFKKRKQLNVSFFNQMPNIMGRERYSMEYWLSSHPSMRPCDVSTNPNISYWLTADRDTSEFELSSAPRFNITSDWFFYTYGRRGPMTLRNESLRMRDYFLLPGQLFRWTNLYNRVPSDQSWVWEWFPDGAVWNAAVKMYGSEAVDVVTRRYVNESNQATR